MLENSIKIPVQRLKIHAKCPKYAYPGDAGFDLCSCINTELKPGERTLIPCGFAIAIPNTLAGLILPRSGLALKHGITVVNSPGLIDSGYRGEICVILQNTDKSKPFQISIGDRIAQMVLIEYKHASFESVENLPESNRSSKGFGSSGKN